MADICILFTFSHNTNDISHEAADLCETQDQVVGLLGASGPPLAS